MSTAMRILTQFMLSGGICLVCSIVLAVYARRSIRRTRKRVLVGEVMTRNEAIVQARLRAIRREINLRQPY